jgi:FemAB family
MKNMRQITKPYFLQTLRWATFWKSAHDRNHSFHQFSHTHNGITYNAIGYTYPWHFGQSFLYLSRFCMIETTSSPSHQEIQIGLLAFLDVVLHKAMETQYSFIKLDTGFDFQAATGIQTNDELVQFLQSSNPKLSIKLSQKTLQYLSTMVLDTSCLVAKNPNQSFLDFYVNNKGFWSKANENVRRYTKKSCSQNWIIDISRTKENFEKFWLVYQHTAQKHDFGIHPKRYFETMILFDFIRLITLSDENGAQSVWLGVMFDDTCYYLYGGNTDESFKKYGQYFIHLVAIDLISQEGLVSYDLGGYDPSKGFGKFKEGYRGEIVSALGPMDIVLKKYKHTLTHSGISTVKTLKQLIKKSLASVTRG